MLSRQERRALERKEKKQDISEIKRLQRLSPEDFAISMVIMIEDIKKKERLKMLKELSNVKGVGPVILSNIESHFIE